MNEWTEMCLKEIDIDDEAMGDLEAFNEKYYKMLNQQALNQPCQCIEEEECDNKDKGLCNQVSLCNHSVESTEIFSLEKYLERVMEDQFTKSALLPLMKDICKLSNGNLNVLPIVKSIKANSKKSDYIKAIINIIHILLKESPNN